MGKKQKRCLTMMDSWLPHDLVERILERLAVKSLGRFKAVSKQWKSTIESPFFQGRQFMLRQQSGDPDVLMLYRIPDSDVPSTSSESSDTESESGSDEGPPEALRSLVLGSSSAVDIYSPMEEGCYLIATSCDGLVCIYHPELSGFVGNPITRCYRPLPISNYQQFILDIGREAYWDLRAPLFKLGFGKDKVNGTYKLVWLYNSSEFGQDDATTCEVFDFTTKAWRFVTHSAPPYRILGPLQPAYVDGSLHWLTDCQETKVLSFDLHTETFQVTCKAPFADAKRNDIVICNLDNRLCVSEIKRPNQVIWSFHPANNTWDKIYSFDISQTCHATTAGALMPLALLDGCKTKKLLFFCRQSRRALVIHDPETNSYDDTFTADSLGYPLCYFPSLISI